MCGNNGKNGGIVIKVFSHWIHWKTISRITIGVLFCIAGLLLALHWLGHEQQVGFASLVYLFILVLLMFTLNAWLGFYQKTLGRSMTRNHSRAVVTLYISAPLPIVYGALAMPTASVANPEFYLLSGLAALLGTLAHLVYKILNRTESLMAPRVLIFGAGLDAQFVGQVLKKSNPDIEIVGFYPGPTEAEICIPGGLVLPRSKTLSETARALSVRQIIIAVHERRGGVLPLRELLDCKLSGVTVLDLSSYFERTLGQIRLNSLRVGWLIFSDGFRQGWGRRLTKRLFDIVSASILLLLAFPVMGITMLMILLEDGFPLFYQQERVGLNGRIFKVIKFRSMRTDAESDGKPRWATADDDRTTRVGRFIRKLRIDELPQLYSVLIGDMSLVGPRPERPYFVDQLTNSIPFYAVRHSVQPGVTGWAQVKYHYGASVEDSIQKLQYDLYYVKNHTLFLDLVIMLETVGVVLTGKGAQ
jgi:sugar transferase (PEP-CTERM system associated)